MKGETTMKQNCCVAILLLLLCVTAIAAPPSGSKSPVRMVTALDYEAYIDANNIFMFVTNQGNYARDLAGVYGHDYGTFFPYNGTQFIEDGSLVASPLYAAGIWAGAVDSATGERLVTVSIYSSEYIPGPILTPAPIATLNDLPEYRVYKLYKDSMANNPNFDYLNWPVDQGAPVDSLGNPALIGDQMCWSVYNDWHTIGTFDNESGSTPPLGLEIHQTTFAFDREGPLGNCIFVKFQIYNKGNKTLEDCYFSLWADPDLGTASDDLVGVDTLTGLGYIYNASAFDGDYSEVEPYKAPPALGFDFFQGPLVYTGLDSDTAKAWDTLWPGYRSLPMASFNKYINGTDPNSADESYNYMLGLNSDGTPLSNGTKFQVPGDPVGRTGELDVAPADRRFMQSTGPITFRPGDSTEIVAGIVVGWYTNQLSSISFMRYYDIFAQSAYEEDFVIPEPPEKPIVSVAQLNKEIVLSWTDTSETDPGDFPFEGYTVYQGASGSGPWTEIATYAVQGVAILDYQLDPISGQLETRVVKNNSPLKVRRYVGIDRDYIKGGDLDNGTTYYFRVEAYSYDGTKTPKMLQSITGVTAIPQSPPADIDLPVGYGDSLATTHVGASDGSVSPFVMNPNALNGHEYEVSFFDTDDGPAWRVTDLTADSIVLDTQFNQSGDDNYLIVDGMLIKVSGPPNDFKSFQVVANGAGPIDPPAAGAFDFGNFPVPLDAEGNPLRPDADQQVGDGLWGIHTADNGGSAGGGTRALYPSFISRAARDGANWPYLIPYDFEIRFTGSNSAPGVNGSYVIEWFNDDNVFWVPFEVWNTGIGTPNDASDDYQMICYIIDDGDDNIFSLESWGDPDNGNGDLEHSVSGGTNDPYTDWIYFNVPTNTTPGTAGYDAAEAQMLSATFDGSTVFHEALARVVLVNWNGGSAPPFTQDCPEQGTVFRIVTTKPNSNSDVFTFTATAPEEASASQATANLDKIVTVPNPYYLFSANDPAVGNYQLQFHHLPRECKISIYSLSGELLRTIDKNDESDRATWDLLTDNNLPVASGIYLWVVDAPGVGQKIGKMAIFTEVEVIDKY